MGSDDGTVDQVQRPRRALRQSLEDAKPDAAFRPSVVAVVDRRARTIALWQIAPRRAGPEYVEDAAEDAPVVNPRDTPRLVRKERRDHRPFRIRQIVPA